VPGQAEGSVALTLGYGHDGAPGSNAYTLRAHDALQAAAPATLTKTGQHVDLAFRQTSGDMRGRDAALHGTLAQYAGEPRAVTRDANQAPPTLYELRPSNPRQQWGMVVDLSACIGCSACVVACQTENNVPFVGEDGVFKGRSMHWLRIDRYFEGHDEDDPAVLLQPMLCQHCEMAPCEYVCPVGATVHSADGLNDMTYNRCVGTRFCSNNCPYKVRRFNWFNYNVGKPQTLRMMMNPDVTVRARGVMEKCTYCVQRIREAEISAHREDRPIRDGEVRTACEATCPTGAIVFGNLADPASRVAALRDNDRTYAALDDLATLPHTRYMARLENPNPEIDAHRGEGAEVKE
jgi:molybdopterin-containing oxidoreductase family iron-sulfur binding subunit